MWEEIEKHITTHRPELDQDLPDDQIWAGIEAGLAERPKRKVRPLREHGFSRAPYWKVAAIILLTIGGSYFAFHPHPLRLFTQNQVKNTDEQPSITAAQPQQAEPLPDPEIAELESYYLSQFNERWAELGRYDLRQFQFTGQFMAELEEVDENYQELRQEIANEGYHAHMVEGLIKTYELKIEILESLLKQIKHDEKTMDRDADGQIIPL